MKVLSLKISFCPISLNLIGGVIFEPKMKTL
jgi:hypothetical protein